MQPVINPIARIFFSSRHRYADSYDQMRARVVLLFSLFIIIADILIILISFTLPRQSNLASGLLIGAIVVGLIPQIVVVALVHSGRLRTAALATYVLLTIAALSAAQDGVTSNLLLMLPIPMMYASLVWQWRGALVTLVVQSLMILFIATSQSQGNLGPTLPIEQIRIHTFLDLVLVVAVGFISGASSYELRRALRYASRLITQLRATSEVAQRTATFIDLSELLKHTANYIRDRFGFYHVQVFLLDREQRFANLAASTSDSAEALLQRGYRLAVGSPGIIGQVTLVGEPQVVNADDKNDHESTKQRYNELLGQTQSELALPLIARDQIIGALDIQSTRRNAFTQEDIESLQIMAAHVSIAINNAQLFQEQRNALNENRRLFLEAEMNLREIQRLNQRLTGEAWEDYLKARSIEVVGYTLSNNQLRQDSSWTPYLEQAATKRHPVTISEGDRQIIAVPVELRGRAIGAIEVEVGSGVRQSDTLEMLQSVAQRLALSIDNARLFEQAQELAQQELEVNAISAKIQSVNSMSEIIKTTISELGRVLGADQASIRLGVERRDKIPSTVSSGSNEGAHA